MRKKRYWIVLALLVSIGLFTLFLARPLQAAEFRGDDNVVIGAGEVIVGTNVIYASTHQNGDAKRKIPARPFLPDEDHPVPQVWWDRWGRLANKALVASATILFRGAA